MYRSERRVDPTDRAGIVVRRPDLAVGVDRDAGRPDSDRDVADQHSLVGEVPDRGISEQAVGDPDIPVLVDGAALGCSCTVWERAEQGAIRRVLERVGTELGDPDVAEQIDARAVAVVGRRAARQHFPVTACWSAQRQAGIPTKQFGGIARRPDHAVRVDQPAVTAVAHGTFGAHDGSGVAVDEVEDAITGSADPDVVVLGHRHMPGTARAHADVLEDALVERRVDAAVGVDAAGVRPELDVVLRR